MLRLFRPWHFFLAFSAVFAVVAGAHPSHPVPPASPFIVLSPPTFDQAHRMRVELKGRIAADVAAARLSLLEAAAAFKELDAPGAACPWAATTNPDSVAADEAYCLSVISWVQVVAPPEQVKCLIHSLQKELESSLREGTFHLPATSVDSTQEAATGRLLD